MKNNIINSKQNNLFNSIFKMLIFFFIIIYTIPRSIDEWFPNIYSIINIIKLCFLPIFNIIMIIKFKNVKKYFNKFSIVFLVFLFFLLLSTIINKVNLITFFKVFYLNAGVVLTVTYLINTDFKKQFIKYSAFYSLWLLVLNLLYIIFFDKLNIFNFGNDILKTYFLGQDNRFVLYIIFSLITFYYLTLKNQKEYFEFFMLTYFIGLISLILVWSASAMVSILMLGIISFYNFKIKKIKINPLIIISLILILSIGIVFFKIHYIFKPLIVDILGKSMTLSYRTYIWDFAIYRLKINPIHFIYGFGYFDTVKMFDNFIIQPNHLHNLLINELFFGGLIGVTLYFSMFGTIISELMKKYKKSSTNFLILLFYCLLILLIFDTFEIFQIYYIILVLLFSINKISPNECEVKNE